jgi:hypothetical protein
MTVATGPVRIEPAPDVVEWLLDDRWPVVRRLTLIELLRRALDHPDVARLTASVATDPWVAPLLAGRPSHPYAKWGGAHWRLFALAELGITADTPGAGPPIEAAAELVMAWLMSPGRRRRIRPIDGRYRNCSSQEGAALWAACTLGVGDGAALRTIAERLVLWQWPDGGWNCDVRPKASHASFNESWMPVRGLVAFRAAQRGASGVAGLDAAIDASVEFFLRHRIVESERSGELANDHIAWLRWPPYWHYALLPGLRAIADAGRLSDPRAVVALNRLVAQRSDDGRWWPDGRFWKGPGSSGSGVELVQWGREGEARMLTLQALALIRAARQQT